MWKLPIEGWIWRKERLRETEVDRWCWDITEFLREESRSPWIEAMKELWGFLNFCPVFLSVTLLLGWVFQSSNCKLWNGERLMRSGHLQGLKSWGGWNSLQWGAQDDHRQVLNYRTEEVVRQRSWGLCIGRNTRVHLGIRWALEPLFPLLWTLKGQTWGSV